MWILQFMAAALRVRPSARLSVSIFFLRLAVNSFSQLALFKTRQQNFKFEVVCGRVEGEDV